MASLLVPVNCLFMRVEIAWHNQHFSQLSLLFLSHITETQSISKFSQLTELVFLYEVLMCWCVCFVLGS
jgi:hypothetical protein